MIKSVKSPFYIEKRAAKKRKIKIRERCANVFVTMPRYDKDARLGALGEFFDKNSPNALCNVQILGI
ncbi:hypothetical protein C5T94_27875 [Raoultella ornithinolytica]|uniref:Uncharacterized protein n=2 Tax=Raoultella ornithinolytica TaxID=54291 RepID=A0A855F7K8_RAOOR|nr:hypothetical protein CA210_07750 [Raoultella ornithinolytica]AXC32393.1 hypothetical protein DSD31_24435 [Raoultella sp. X13]ATM23355.1 hypothetical protein CRN13_24580 [Raoultella ornithinolytica]OWP36989.1 hypothetical protein CEG93_28365 [Raoultella ornithinolytica]OWY85073.1 hypothetical protein CAC00_25410 [Raoultella ornithinolytica]